MIRGRRTYDIKFVEQLKKDDDWLQTESTDTEELEIHSDKTKIIINQNSKKLKEIEIDGIHVEILRLKET